MPHPLFVAKHKYGYLWEVQSRNGNGPSYQVVLKPDGSVHRVTNVSSLRSLNPMGSTASRLLSAIRSVSPSTKPSPQSATVIEAPHYRETVNKLLADPLIVHMALGLKSIPRERLVHENGKPRFEFMQRANSTYTSRGGKVNGHIGAVAEAVLHFYDADKETPVS